MTCAERMCGSCHRRKWEGGGIPPFTCGSRQGPPLNVAHSLNVGYGQSPKPTANIMSIVNSYNCK